MMSAVILFASVAVCGCFPGHHPISMSPQEQEQATTLLRDAYAAFNRDDIPAAVKSLDPNIQWSEPVAFPGGGLYRGRTEVARYLTNSRANWAEGTSQPVQFIVHDDRVVVYVHARFRLKDSATWTEVDLADVYTFRNGKPVAMRAFADRQAALQWVDAGPHRT